MRSISGDICFLLADEKHPLDWSYDEKIPHKYLILETSVEPGDAQNTVGVEVFKVHQKRGTWALVFQLVSPEYSEIFQSFCRDVIVSSYNISPELGPDFALSRYEHWLQMFKPRKNILPESTIQGLIGELIILREKMFVKYGQHDSLVSWMNKNKGKQDFIFNDLWYEIKTIMEGKQSVHISSLEQLDRCDPGRMVVVTLRKSGNNVDDKITLNSIYSDLFNSLEDPECQELLFDTMCYAGFVPCTEYDDYCYQKVDISEYVINTSFPRIRRSEVDNRVVKGSYDISLGSIKEYRV